jgi:hypothetical protein
MSRQVVIAVALVAALTVIGSGVFILGWWRNNDAAAVTLMEDEAMLRERKAIERLKEKGCHAEERTDEWIGEAGILLRLFPEHIDEKGHILPELFAELRYLQNCFLVLDETPISNEGLSDLKSLDNLLLLSLQATPVTDEGLGHIEGIISLRLLRLNWTRITDHGLRYIDRLPDLVVLYVSGTRITDDAMEHIVGLKKLAALQMASTKITDKACAKLPLLPELQFLGLDQTKVTDVGVTYLSACPKLSYVNLTKTALTDERLIELRAELPRCRVVRNVTLDHVRAAPLNGNFPARK